ncbi:MAG: M48 family metallopeptidase [Kiloniellales bacterium]
MTLAVQRNRRARRLTLRVDQRSGELRLVLPQRVPLREGLDFAERKVDWIRDQLAALAPQRPFIDGAELPYLGAPHVIRHAPGARRGVWREAGGIWVSGHADHLSRRVTDFLKRAARDEIAARARAKAAVIERPPARVTLRDTKSRWGSCAASGELSFSWRLIMAPEAVLDYVVAHEVAHLVHMNHSRRFWKLVARLTAEVAGPERWLRDQGNGLLRYG